MDSTERKVFSPVIEEIIDDNDYEVVLETATPATTKSGKECLVLDFAIREDVDQKFKKWHVKEYLFRDVDDPRWYDSRKLHRIILTQPNPKLEFKNCDECVQYINGLKLKIGIGVREYQDASGDLKKTNEVKRNSYARSEAKVSAPVTSSKDVPVVDLPGDVEDADVPF